MENFTYHSLFDTKGIEYLIIIAFFLVLIPFWLILKRREGISLAQPILNLSAKIMNTPLGVFFNPNHTWTYLEPSGQAKIGLDQIIANIAGDFSFRILAKPGTSVCKFDPIARIQQGDKTLIVRSPISGIVQDANLELENDAGDLIQDPFESGWILAVEPEDWKADTQKCILGEQARSWLRNELNHIRDFIVKQSQTDDSHSYPLALQDGGEPGQNALSHLSDAGWQHFQDRFM